MSRTLFGTLAAIVLALLAAGRPLAAGLDLSWSDCVPSPHARAQQSFACDGAIDREYALHAQFRTQAAFPRLVGATATLDVLADPREPLLPFWHYEPGACNGPPAPGLTVSAAMPASCAVRCVADAWSEGGPFVHWSYQADAPAAGRGRLIVTGALGAPGEVQPDVPYHAFQIRFNDRQRATCAGCDRMIQILFTSLVLEAEDGFTAWLSGPDRFTDCVTVNGGLACPITVRTAADDEPCKPLETHAATWGLIKALYR